MSTSTRFERDLDRLINTGSILHNAIQYACHSEEFKEQVVERMGAKDAAIFLSDLPNFKSEYQSWYSEALAVIRQILPDRLSDFRSHYEFPRVRKDISFQNYMVRDYLQGLQITRFSGEVVADGGSAIPEFVQQLSILRAARATLSSSLMNLTSILQADLFDSEIDSARALAKGGFLRAAGAVCGVVIEKHLKQVCVNHNIPIRKRKPTISDFNQALKNNGSVTTPQWRHIQHLADIRNLCDHDGESEPQMTDIDDLLSGTSKILKTIY